MFIRISSLLFKMNVSFCRSILVLRTEISATSFVLRLLSYKRLSTPTFNCCFTQRAIQIQLKSLLLNLMHWSIFCLHISYRTPWKHCAKICAKICTKICAKICAKIDHTGHSQSAHVSSRIQYLWAGFLYSLLLFL